MSLADDVSRTQSASAFNVPGSKRKPTTNVSYDATTGEAEATFEVGQGQTTEEAFHAILAKMLPEVPADRLVLTDVRAWGSPHSPYKYVKARPVSHEDRLDEVLAECMERIRRRRPRKPRNKTVEATAVIPWADLQIGKAQERWGGTPETCARVDEKLGKALDKLREVRKTKRVERIFAPGMGDTTEGCGQNPNYAKQDFTVDCNESEQVEIATELHDKIFDVLSREVSELWSTTISSNHDVKRVGKAEPTGRADNRAFTIWRSLARAYAKNDERYGHVKLWLPDDPNVASVDLHGKGVAAIHGDIPRKGSTPAEKMWRWWDGQRAGDHPGHVDLHAGRCDVLLTAHYHHFWSVHQCGRWAFGCPSLDGGSGWFTDAQGVWSDPGLLFFVVSEEGVTDIEVL